MAANQRATPSMTYSTTQQCGARSFLFAHGLHHGCAGSTQKNSSPGNSWTGIWPQDGLIW
ncbi:unnamed protein product [Prunus armeniaca]